MEKKKKKIVMFFCMDCLRTKAFKEINFDSYKYECLDCGRKEKDFVVRIGIKR